MSIGMDVGVPVPNMTMSRLNVVLSVPPDVFFVLVHLQLSILLVEVNIVPEQVTLLEDNFFKISNLGVGLLVFDSQPDYLLILLAKFHVFFENHLYIFDIKELDKRYKLASNRYII